MPVAAGEATPSQVTTMPAAPLSVMTRLLSPASPMMRSVFPVTGTVQLGHQRHSRSSRRRLAPLFAGRRGCEMRCENMVVPPKQGRDVGLRSDDGPSVATGACGGAGWRRLADSRGRCRAATPLPPPGGLGGLRANGVIPVLQLPDQTRVR